MEIIVKASDYGLEETKAAEIEVMFKPMLATMTGLELKYNVMAAIPREELTPELCKAAGQLRKKYVEVRTGTSKVHKKLKQFYLQGGRFVDGWKNAQLMAGQGIEDKLMAIEKHFVNIEIEKIAKLQEQRAAEFSNFLDPDENFVIPDNLGEMNEEIWKNFIVGTKSNYETQKAAEKKVADDEARTKRLEQLANARRDQLAPYAYMFENWNDFKFGEITAVEFDELLTNSKATAEEKRKSQLSTEKENRSLKEKVDQANQKEIDRLAEIENNAQVELDKDDKAKVSDLLSDLEAIKSKYAFTSKANQKMYSDVGILIDKVIGHIKPISK